MARSSIELFKIALVFLFTYQGVPCVYYGDEIGMGGGGDPDCRRPMEWDREKWNWEIWRFYQRLIALRRGSQALQKGCLQMIDHACGVVYLRESAEERWLIALNRGDAADNGGGEGGPVKVGCAGIADGTRWQEVFSAVELVVQNGMLPAVPQGAGAAVWREMTE